MSVSVIRNIVQVIWDQLHSTYIPLPNETKWNEIASNFLSTWNLPNCIGAIDGKHVAITCPSNSGSQFYNYKGTYSIVLLAVCDVNYNFIAVDVGAFGNQSDGGVLTYSNFGKKLFGNNLGLPNCNTIFPYYLVGDAAFPVEPYLMRPYPGLLLPDEKNNSIKGCRELVEQLRMLLVY